ncbi:MAG: hypothetical protein H0X65_09195, partial [Gemmatimonadetes bacterium]|nr:hypothetical protein [Gemmatimonadota bacterium]
PFNGPVSLRINGEARVIARALADRIRVSPLGAAHSEGDGAGEEG